MKSIIRSIFHFLIIIAAFYAAYLIRGYTDLIPFTQLYIPPIHLPETMLYGIISAIIFTSIGIAYWLYPIKKYNYNYLRTMFDCFLVRLVCITFLAFFGTGFLFIYGISRLVIAFAFSMSFLAIILFDMIYDSIITREKQSILIINNSENEEIIWSLHEFDAVQEYVIAYEPMIEIKPLLEKYSPDSVLVLWDIPHDSLQYIADKVNIAGIQMLHISEWMLLDDLDFQISRFWPILWLQYRSHNITERDAIVKRIVDIIWSSLGLIILSPIMIITAICIKLFDHWPIFYKHQRVGRNGILFDYIKFRSMKVEDCTGEYFGTPQSEQHRKELQDSKLNVRKWELQKIKNDPRITSIGRIIRKYSIDELPSLRCILRGNMSMVGPRPHLQFEVERYQPWMKRLLSVKPGMTCYSQIYGRDKLPFSDEAKFDIYYISNRSLLFDFYIIIATVKVLFKGR